jgi:glutamine synthetase
MYTEGDKAASAKKLPLNLLDALRTLEKSSVLRSAFGEETLASYLKLKYDDWTPIRAISPNGSARPRWIAE